MICDVITNEDNVVIDGFLSSLDLILKWMSLHVDTNKAQVIGALLECLNMILHILKSICIAHKKHYKHPGAAITGDFCIRNSPPLV